MQLSIYWYVFNGLVTKKNHKRQQKLAHNFSRVSVGIELVTIVQAAKARQHSKEIKLDKSFDNYQASTAEPISRSRKLKLSLLHGLHIESYLEIIPPQQFLNPDVDKLRINNLRGRYLFEFGASFSNRVCTRIHTSTSFGSKFV